MNQIKHKFINNLKLTGMTAVVLMTLSTAQAQSGLPVEVISEFNDIRPANVTVTPQGRIITTMHPLDDAPIRMMEVTATGTQVPFPTLDWADGPEKGTVGISLNIGIASDADGIVWSLDMGGSLQGAQLIGWDTIKNELHKRVPIDKSAYIDTSFMQDFALDTKRNKVYVADMTFTVDPKEASPSIIVIDLETGKARRTMEGDKAFLPEINKIVINDSLVGTKNDAGQSIPFYLGLNPITIDPDNEWVYFGGVNGTTVYRIQAEALASEMSDEDMSAKIEVYGPKPPSDGIKVDGNGNVYITDIVASGIGVTTKGKYELVAQDDELLSWVDGLAIGPDGGVYGTQNHLHANPALNEGVDESKKPFRIIKIMPK